MWYVCDVLYTYSVLDAAVISGENVCLRSVVFGTLVGVFSVIWYELLMPCTL